MEDNNPLDIVKKSRQAQANKILETYSPDSEIFTDLLEKGKRGLIGEKRTWDGIEYVKTQDGWKPSKKGTEPKKGVEPKKTIKQIKEEEKKRKEEEWKKERERKDREIAEFNKAYKGKINWDNIKPLKKEPFTDYEWSSAFNALNWDTKWQYPSSGFTSIFSGLDFSINHEKAEDGFFEIGFKKGQSKDFEKLLKLKFPGREFVIKKKTEGVTIRDNNYDHALLVKPIPIKGEKGWVGSDEPEEEKKVNPTRQLDERDSAIQKISNIGRAQPGSVISGSDLLDPDFFKEAILEEDPSLSEAVDHLLTNVKGQSFEFEDLLPTSKLNKFMEGELSQEDIFETGELYPVSKLSKEIKPPKGFSKFSIVQDDGGSVTVAFFTKEGEKYYSDKISVDL